MSRLQRLREKRVQTRVHALLSCFLVPHLQIRTHSNVPSGFLGRRAAIICVFVNERRPHFTLQLSNSFSEVSLGGLRQLRVEALGEALPAALLVFTLRVNTLFVIYRRPERRVRKKIISFPSVIQKTSETGSLISVKKRFAAFCG